MHSTLAVVVAVHQGIRQSFPEGFHPDARHRHAEQADLHLPFRVVGPEVGLQPVQSFEQRETPELVELHRFALQDLKSELVGGDQLLQGDFATDEEQPRQGRRATAAIGQPRRHAKGAVERFIVKLQQDAVAAVLLHALTKAFALQGIQISERRAGHDLRRSIHQAETAHSTGPVMGEHGHTFR